MEPLTLAILIIAVLTAIVGALIYSCYNLLRKLEVHEEWVSEFRTEIEIVNKKLREVDDRHLFEPDEDVGFIFSELVRIMKEFDDKIK